MSPISVTALTFSIILINTLPWYTLLLKYWIILWCYICRSEASRYLFSIDLPITHSPENPFFISIYNSEDISPPILLLILLLLMCVQTISCHFELSSLYLHRICICFWFGYVCTLNFFYKFVRNVLSILLWVKWKQGLTRYGPR